MIVCVGHSLSLESNAVDQLRAGGSAAASTCYPARLIIDLSRPRDPVFGFPGATSPWLEVGPSILSPRGLVLDPSGDASLGEAHPERGRIRTPSRDGVQEIQTTPVRCWDAAILGIVEGDPPSWSRDRRLSLASCESRPYPLIDKIHPDLEDWHVRLVHYQDVLAGPSSDSGRG